MNEEEFTKNLIMPLLRKVGFKRIRYVHGTDEYGRDVIFFDKDRLGLPIVCACQVKLGDIKGTQKRKIQNEIVPQLLEGLRTEYRNPETGESYNIQRMYLIISGRLIGTAKEQIYSLINKEPNIFVIDFQSIDLLSGGDGFETSFMYTVEGSNTSLFATLKHTPRLPLLHKGMVLDITIDLEEYGYTDYIEIVEVCYDPILREQTITIKLPVEGNTELTHSSELKKLADKKLNEWFESTGLFLSELIEFENKL